MSVSQEFRDYFSELIESLATNECLEQMLQKLKEKIFTKFERRFIKWTRKKDELKTRVSFQENTINQLFIKCDDNEPCSRRNSYEFTELNLKK